MEECTIGTCRLGKTPAAVAIIDGVIDASAVVSLQKKGVELFEIRFDRFGMPVEKTVDHVRKLRRAAPFSCIGTVRENHLTRSNRLEWFRLIMETIDAVDIERDAAIAPEVIRMAKGAQKRVIVSEHDFVTTPADARMERIIEQIAAAGADIVKLAVTARCREDVLRLLHLTEKARVPLVGIAMGAPGKISRVIAPLYGSLFTYGYITGEVAPGQLSIEDLLNELRRFYPEFDERCRSMARGSA